MCIYIYIYIYAHIYCLFVCLFVCMLEYNMKTHTLRVFIKDPPHKEMLHRSSSDRRDGHNTTHDSREGSIQAAISLRDASRPPLAP